MKSVSIPHYPDTAMKAPHSQWQQVLDRDCRADGKFFYGVRSTKIYCRPSCPSRRPGCDKVSFFPTAAAAREAGFRPCKRCRPDVANAANDAQIKLAKAVAEYLASHANERTRLADLACSMGVSRLALLRGFRRALGLTPAEFARAQRATRFQQSLAGEVETLTKRITDAIYEAGYGSSSRLYETSAQSFGMSPRALRSGGENEIIRFTTAQSPLGRILVAATDLGICFIAFAETDDELTCSLRKRFPKAQLVLGQKNSHWLNSAVTFIASQTTEHPSAAAFPMDIRATAFQQRVWKALQQIPLGETRSYSALARELGNPAATRAVAAACGQNPIAVAIPCHRVVGKDGSLTGYRWGLERKRQLLAAESEHRGPIQPTGTADLDH